jgi:hypothetical protein
MKALRFLTVMIIAVLVISAWAPVPAYAKSVETQATSNTNNPTVDVAKAAMAKLTVDNRTGGALYVSLSGPRSYSFATSKPGKTTFGNILPGKYTVVLRSSRCRGSLTYTKSIKGTTSLKPLVCR